MQLITSEATEEIMSVTNPDEQQRVRIREVSGRVVRALSAEQAKKGIMSLLKAASNFNY